MNIDDLLVEVRNSALERKGAILKDDLQLEAEIPFNSVGDWTITIAKDHPLADTLASPGGGIVVTDLSSGEVLFSGPTVQPEEARTVENIAGQIVVQGITDEHILDDALAWPDPINGDITTQSEVQDERAGTAEEVIHGYIAGNIGLFAPPSRRNPRLVMGEQSGLGATVESTARFDKLITLAQNLALPDGIGFRVRQHGTQLRFETYLPRDQRRLVRLSFENDGLSTSRLASAAPTVTHAIVAGKAGIYREVTDSDSREAGTQWGRRIETFVDQQDTANTDTMKRAGQEALKDGGFTSTNARFEPTETIRSQFVSEWNLGDTLAVESGSKTYTAPVTAVIYRVDSSDGFRIGAILGDPSVFNGYASLSTRLDKVVAQAGTQSTKPPADTSAMEQLKVDLTNLNTVVLPQVQTDLAAARQSVAGLAGLFPVGSTSISDGAISTPKMVANTINGDRIAANTLHAQKIVGETITGDKIAGNTITGDKIVVNSISAAHLSATAIDGKTISGATFTGGQISIGSSFFANSAGVSLNANFLTINGTNPLFIGTGGVSSVGTASFRGLNIPSGGIDVQGGGISSNSFVTASGAITGGSLTSTSQTGSEGQAAVFGSGGQVKRGNPSARKYKTDINPADIDPLVALELEPVEYRYLPDSGFDDNRVHYGFIADQAHALRLNPFVLYYGGEVDSFKYAEWVVALQSIVRHLAQQITDLQGEVADLRAA